MAMPFQMKSNPSETKEAQEGKKKEEQLIKKLDKEEETDRLKKIQMLNELSLTDPLSLQNPNFPKHLVISIGDFSYLMVSAKITTTCINC